MSPGPSKHDKDAFVFYNGEFRRYHEVVFGLVTHAIHYGTGCFEGIRGYWNGQATQLNMFRAKDHYERLRRSARILMLDLPYEADALVDVTVELLRRNAYKTNCYVRPILFKAGDGIGVPYADVPTGFGIYTSEFGQLLDNDKGIRCKVSTWRRVPDSAIPVRAKVTGAYINSHLAKREAVMDGYDEAIVLDVDGHVSEATGENLFMVKGGKFVTPSESSDILEGITRSTIMDLVEDDLGGVVVERTIDRSELYACDEVFLCGTGAEITPVIEVDGRQVGTGKPGERTRQIMELYSKVVGGHDSGRAGWLTPVY